MAAWLARSTLGRPTPVVAYPVQHSYAEYQGAADDLIELWVEVVDFTLAKPADEESGAGCRDDGDPVYSPGSWCCHCCPGVPGTVVSRRSQWPKPM
jgi:hypothetical protein